MDSGWLTSAALSDGEWGVVGSAVSAALGAVLGGVVTYLLRLREQREARATTARALAAQVAAEHRADAVARQAELRTAYLRLLAWASDFVDDADPDRVKRAPAEAVSTVELDGPESVLAAMWDLQEVRRQDHGPDWAIHDARARLRLMRAVQESATSPAVTAVRDPGRDTTTRLLEE